MPDLKPSFARTAKAEIAREAAFQKLDAEVRRVAKIGRCVVKPEIKKAGWVRGETLLARVRGGWAIGIYQGISLSYGPQRAGEKWAFVIHTLSVLGSGKPGKKKSFDHVSVDHPCDIFALYKIVGTIKNAKAKR